MEYTIIAQSALADHSITIFNLAGINIVDLFAAVRLADLLGRAIVLHSLLSLEPGFRTVKADLSGLLLMTVPSQRSCFAILSIFSIFSWAGAAWTSSTNTGKASTDPHNRVNSFFAM